MNSVKEIAKKYGFSERTIYRDLKSGVFPHTKNNRDAYVISEQNIERWIKNRQSANFNSCEKGTLNGLQSSISELNQNVTEHVPKHYNKCGGSRKNYKGVKYEN